jgi:hypothetical protein
MPVAPVVEARLDLDAEGQLASHAEHTPDQPVPEHAAGRVVDRHEVLHLADAALGEEAGDQDIGVREVELLGRPAVCRRGDPVVAAATPVEDRAEHARRVEVGAAVPVDRPVRADQRGRVQVADDPVLGDRQIARERAAGAVLWVGRHVCLLDAVLSRRASALRIR